MRIALVSNWQTQACGVANFGRDWKAALERAGHEVTPRWWRDLPDQWAELTLFNWHPATSAAYFEWPVPYAVYLHDIPPHSRCGLVGGAKAVFASEPCEGTTEIPYPVWDGGTYIGAPLSPVTIGWSGLRGDGREHIREVCAKRGWIFNSSNGWLDTPAEVHRLAASTLIVLWYFASGRGQSLALSTACATGRPILVNHSQMFNLADRYPEEIYRAGRYPPTPYLEQAIETVLNDFAKGKAKRPVKVRQEQSWANAIVKMEAAWTPK